MNCTQRSKQAVKRLVRSLGCSVWPEYGPSGNCPVQAEGRICLPNRKPVFYYFRARGQTISMRFHRDAMGCFKETAFWFSEETEAKYSAGWITKAHALRFMREAILAWKAAPYTKITHG